MIHLKMHSFAAFELASTSTERKLVSLVDEFYFALTEFNMRKRIVLASSHLWLDCIAKGDPRPEVSRAKQHSHTNRRVLPSQHAPIPLLLPAV